MPAPAIPTERIRQAFVVWLQSQGYLKQETDPAIKSNMADKYWQYDSVRDAFLRQSPGDIQYAPGVGPFYGVGVRGRTEPPSPSSFAYTPAIVSGPGQVQEPTLTRPTQSFYGGEETPSLPSSPLSVGTAPPQRGVTSSKVNEILSQIPSPYTRQGVIDARMKILQYLNGLDLSINPDGSYKDPNVDSEERAALKALSELKDIANDITAAGAGVGGAGRETTEYEKFQMGPYFEYQKEQAVAERQRLIENEKQRVKEALASMQMQGTNIMGSAYNQALSMYERAARAAVPPGATYVPGYEPGGSMAKLYGFSGIPFQPQTVAQGTTPFNAFQAMPQVESGIAAAMARAIGGGQ